MADPIRFTTPARLSLAGALGLALVSSLWMPGADATPAPPAAAGATTTLAPVAVPASTRAARAPAVGCLIGPERVADIGTPVTGVVAAIHVDRGDRVRAGQPLVLLDSAVEQAGVQAAQTRAAVDADVRAAEANLALLQGRVRRAEGLLAEGFVAPQAVEQARAERDVAEQKLAQARAQSQVQRQELGIVRAQLGQRTLKAPFAGVVAERFIDAGERAEEKPLLRVAMVDPLRVELVVPASRWGSIARGDRLPIVPELPGAEAVQARVTHVDPLLDAASNTFRVRLALANPGHRIPAGARCRLDLPQLATPPAPATPATPAAGATRPAPAAAAAPPAARPLPTAGTAPAAAPARPKLKFTI